MPARSLSENIGLFLKGLAMGAANKVPGVSGGTIAFITGIYEELIDTINKIDFNAFKTVRQKGIKTLMVAYGDGIRPDGMKTFDEVAVVGSCENAGDKDCESTIVARTPEKLQTELSQRIRQILAERLAFTAPSITATIQEGGSLYQAQFSYEQYGEWQGTLLRKKLNSDGTVDHELSTPGNWSAAKEIKGQASETGTKDERNLWTAMPGKSYIGNWDNFHPDFMSSIKSLLVCSSSMVL